MHKTWIQTVQLNFTYMLSKHTDWPLTIYYYCVALLQGSCWLKEKKTCEEKGKDERKHNVHMKCIFFYHF